MSEEKKVPKQVPGPDGTIPGGQALVDAFDQAMLDKWEPPDWNAGGVPYIDPDLPVWGTINKAEVD